MKIAGWTCVVSVGDQGELRAAAHPEGGSIASLNGRLLGHCDCPAEVVMWLLRPTLRATWRNGWEGGYDAAKGLGDPVPNPFDGDPLNKDKDPS